MCISLITFHMLIGLWTCFYEVHVQIFWPFFYWIVLYWFVGILYIFWIRVLWQLHMLQISSPMRCLPFYSMLFFWRTQFFNLNEVQFISYFFYNYCSLCLFKNIFLSLRSRKSSLKLSSRRLIVLPFTFRPTVYLELISV